jgi:hypothetical protein
MAQRIQTTLPFDKNGTLKRVLQLHPQRAEIAVGIRARPARTTKK